MSYTTEMELADMAIAVLLNEKAFDAFWGSRSDEDSERIMRNLSCHFGQIIGRAFPERRNGDA